MDIIINLIISVIYISIYSCVNKNKVTGFVDYH